MIGRIWPSPAEGEQGDSPDAIRSRQSLLRLLLLASVAAAACGDAAGPSEPSPPRLGSFSGDTTLALSKAAGAALAVATTSRGFSFFDNFLPCPARGVIHYADRPGSSVAEAHSCDLGDGVVLDGALVIVAATDGASAVVAVDVAGDATALTDSDTMALPALRVEGIRVAVGAGRGATIDPDSATIRAFDATVAYDPRGAPAAAFAVPGSIDLPNADNALTALSEADVRRLAFDPLLALAALLFDEQLEIARGPHTHTFPCGSLDVLPDSASGLTAFDAAFEECTLPSGTRLNGTFSARWTAFGEQGLTMAMDGSLTIAGGVPTIRLDGFEWSAVYMAQPDLATFSGMLVVGAASREYLFDVPISD